jgi:hypothetical protein
MYDIFVIDLNKGTLTLETTSDMTAITWQYNMTLHFVSSGTSHTEDDTLAICSRYVNVG